MDPNHLPSLEEQILVAIRRIVRAIELRSQVLVAKHGLTGPQIAVLRLVERTSSITPTALARELRVSQPTASGLVDRLVQRGLLLRVLVPEDRRKHAVRLSEKGQAAVAQAPSLFQDEFKDRLRRLENWEQTMMLSSLQRVAVLMDAETVPATAFLTPGAAPAGADVPDGAPTANAEVNDAKTN